MKHSSVPGREFLTLTTLVSIKTCYSTGEITSKYAGNNSFRFKNRRSLIGSLIFRRREQGLKIWKNVISSNFYFINSFSVLFLVILFFMLLERCGRRNWLFDRALTATKTDRWRDPESHRVTSHAFFCIYMFSPLFRYFSYFYFFYCIKNEYHFQVQYSIFLL